MAALLRRCRPELRSNFLAQRSYWRSMVRAAGVAQETEWSQRPGPSCTESAVPATGSIRKLSWHRNPDQIVVWQ
ncbi:hypothetical protein DPMN_159652 [Dreissena polymorpha]|uniref:Uncharacterized protein n=1 Tax=Dreissena polymorpha TaxID=45954 RepID=A0A9D4ELC2_DREPO|nr:hypothetical protein DPMN_159652 [Dreissena polymorpha]